MPRKTCAWMVLFMSGPGFASLAIELRYEFESAAENLQNHPRKVYDRIFSITTALITSRSDVHETRRRSTRTVLVYYKGSHHNSKSRQLATVQQASNVCSITPFPFLDILVSRVATD